MRRQQANKTFNHLLRKKKPLHRHNSQMKEKKMKEETVIAYNVRAMISHFEKKVFDFIDQFSKSFC